MAWIDSYTPDVLAETARAPSVAPNARLAARRFIAKWKPEQLRSVVTATNDEELWEAFRPVFRFRFTLWALLGHFFIFLGSLIVMFVAWRAGKVVPSLWEVYSLQMRVLQYWIREEMRQMAWRAAAEAAPHVEQTEEP